MRPEGILVLFCLVGAALTAFYGGKLATDVTNQVIKRGCLTEKKIEKITKGNKKMSEECKKFLEGLRDEERSASK